MELRTLSGPFKSSLLIPDSQTHRDRWNPFLKSLRKEKFTSSPWHLSCFYAKVIPDLGTVDLPDTSVLLVGPPCALQGVHSIPGLCPPGSRSPPPHSCDNQNVSRHCLVSPGGQIPLVESHCPRYTSFKHWKSYYVPGTS